MKSHLIPLFCFVLLFYSNTKTQSTSQINRDILIGEGFAHNKSLPEDVLLAKQNAMADLASQIQVKVVSNTKHELEEKGKNISEYFLSKINLLSEINLPGVEWEIKQGEIITARAILDKSKAVKYYEELIKQYESKIIPKKINIENSIKRGEKDEALNQLFNILPLIDNYEQNILLLFSLTNEFFKKAENTPSHEWAQSLFRELNNSTIESLDDVAPTLSFSISKLIQKNSSIVIYPFTFEDTDWGSEFSNYLMQKIRNVLPSFRNYKKLIDKNEMPENSTEDLVIISGSYWIKKESVEILVTLYKKSGSFCGSTKTEFPINLLDTSGIQYKPKNFIDAFSDNKYFAKDEIVYGDLKFDFWTNKGDKNLLFKNSETMKLYVRVNTPCYISFIYHLVSGYRTPLYENYYIDNTKVNKVVELPDEFICSPPFGVEKLQIFGSTNKMPVIKTTTTMIEGQEYDIVAEDLPSFLASTRGFLKKRTDEVKVAERVITITTIEK